MKREPGMWVSQAEAQTDMMEARKEARKYLVAIAAVLVWGVLAIMWIGTQA